MLQDIIETTLLATGAPVSTWVVSLNNGEKSHKPKIRTIKQVFNILYQ